MLCGQVQKAGVSFNWYACALCSGATAQVLQQGGEAAPQDSLLPSPPRQCSWASMHMLEVRQPTFQVLPVLVVGRNEVTFTRGQGWYMSKHKHSYPHGHNDGWQKRFLKSGKPDFLHLERLSSPKASLALCMPHSL